MSHKFIHGCCIILGNKGILIRGKSGSGKSELARTLIENWEYESGFARWVSDDQVEIDPHPGAIIARAPKQIKGLAERRFGGIENITHENAARLDLIVDLIPIEQLDRLPDEKFAQLNDKSPSIVILHVPQSNPSMAVKLVLARIQDISQKL